jgi:hypothetical protein
MRPDSDAPTTREMFEEVLDLITGLGVLLLPLSILAIPGLILLLPLALPLIPLALLVPPFLIARSVWRTVHRAA